jgi:site-specific recombinase XerC
MARDRFRLVEDDDGLFVERNGKRIAKRGVGRHAKQWISLEPGVVVYGDGDLVIEQHGAALH